MGDEVHSNFSNFVVTLRVPNRRPSDHNVVMLHTFGFGLVDSWRPPVKPKPFCHGARLCCRHFIKWLVKMCECELAPGRETSLSRFLSRSLARTQGVTETRVTQSARALPRRLFSLNPSPTSEADGGRPDMYEWKREGPGFRSQVRRVRPHLVSTWAYSGCSKCPRTVQKHASEVNRIGSGSVCLCAYICVCRCICVNTYTLSDIYIYTCVYIYITLLCVCARVY